VLRGRFDDLLATPTAQRDDFVALELTDPAPVPEAQRRLGEVFPRIVGLSYLALAAPVSTTSASPEARRSASPLDLFAAFFEAQRGAPLSDTAKDVAVQAIAAAEAETA
jgi:exonuclease SbcD